MPTMSRSVRSRNSTPSSDVSSPPKTRCSNCFGVVDLSLIDGFPRVVARMLATGTGRAVTANLRYLLSLQEAGCVILPAWSHPDGCSEDTGEAHGFGLNPAARVQAEIA